MRKANTAPGPCQGGNMRSSGAAPVQGHERPKCGAGPEMWLMKHFLALVFEIDFHYTKDMKNVQLYL